MEWGLCCREPEHRTDVGDAFPLEVERVERLVAVGGVELVVWSFSSLGSGSASLVVHAACLFVQVVCVTCGVDVHVGDAQIRTFVLSAGLCAARATLLLVSLFLGLPALCVVAARAVAVRGGALLFSCWINAIEDQVMRLCVMMFGDQRIGRIKLKIVFESIVRYTSCSLHV